MNIVIEGLKEIVFKGSLTVPGDKSITHRVVILASVANGITSLNNFSDGWDCQNTIACMRELGVPIEKADDHLLTIQGRGLLGLRAPHCPLDVGNSGTTMRLLAGLLSGQKFVSILDGDESIRKRPMRRIIEPLSLMNGCIECLQKGGFAPLNITGKTLLGIDYTLPVASAQVKSALLLAGLYAQEKTAIYEREKTRDHTERLLALMGADIKSLPDHSIVLKPVNTLKGTIIDIPGDISSAAYFLALAAAREGAEMLIKNVGINPTRIGFLKILLAMGAKIFFLNKRQTSNEPRADIKICGGPLKGISIDHKLIPSLIDELPLVAVLATQAQGKTLVTDARELRVKETDRIKAIVQGLSQMGADIREKDDGFEIIGPTKLKGATLNSYSDHRIAMSFIIAASYAQGRTEILKGECISISYPDFLSSYFRMID